MQILIHKQSFSLRTEIFNICGGFSGNSAPFGQVSGNFVLLRRIPKPPLLVRCAADALRESDSRNQMFVLGMGYVGQFLAQELKGHGWVVSGTCRSTSKLQKLQEKGFNAYPFDATDPDQRVLTTMKYHTHLLVSIPPASALGDLMFQHEEFLRSSLMDGNIQWLCYLSSTSVYGNSNGAWVDEDCSINPASGSAKLRVAAEEKWMELGKELGLSAQVFRLGGIYGPGRSAVDTIIKKKLPSAAQSRRASKRYTSRIHVADICQALKASIRMPKLRNIYNIVDDDPAPRAEVFAFARRLIEKKWPEQIEPCASHGGPQSFMPGRGFEGEKQVLESFMPQKDFEGEKQVVESLTPEKDFEGEKRVSNARMKEELGVKLIYPDYRTGLQNIINNMENPF